MSGEQKNYLVNWVFKFVLMTCATLISIIFYTMKDDVHSIGKDVTDIKINMQRVEDRLNHQGDAINELNRKTEYLQDKKKDK